MLLGAKGSSPPSCSLFQVVKAGKERRLREIRTSSELPHKLQWTFQTKVTSDSPEIKTKSIIRNPSTAPSPSRIREGPATAARALTLSLVHRSFQGTERFSGNYRELVTRDVLCTTSQAPSLTATFSSNSPNTSIR